MPRGTSLIDEARLQGRLWVPTSPSDAYLWLDASEIASINFEPNPQVRYWNDRRGRYFSESFNRPEYQQAGLNGRPTISFNGAGNYMRLGNDLLADRGDFCMVFVMQSSGGDNDGIFGPSTASGVGLELFFFNNANAIGINGAVQGFGANTIFSTDGLPAITTVKRFGSTVEARKNGTTGALYTATSNALNHLNNYDISSYANSAIYSTATKFSELVISSQDNSRALEGYMAYKWGLVDYLSADHPFRNRPPLIGD